MSNQIGELLMTGIVPAMRKTDSPLDQSARHGAIRRVIRPVDTAPPMSAA